MKIAVPTREGVVDDHFGHCAYYTIFDIVDGKIAGVSKMASPQGYAGHGRRHVLPCHPRR